MTTFGEQMEALRGQGDRQQYEMNRRLMHAIDRWDNNLGGLRSDLYHDGYETDPPEDAPGRRRPMRCRAQLWQVEAIQLMGEWVDLIRDEVGGRWCPGGCGREIEDCANNSEALVAAGRSFSVDVPSLHVCHDVGERLDDCYGCRRVNLSDESLELEPEPHQQRFPPGS